jgi:hypothetical protein
MTAYRELTLKLRALHALTKCPNPTMPAHKITGSKNPRPTVCNGSSLALASPALRIENAVKCTDDYRTVHVVTVLAARSSFNYEQSPDLRTWSYLKR